MQAKGKVKEVKTTIKLCGTEPAVPTGSESPTERSKRGSGGGENGPRETESSGGGKRAIWEGEYDEKASAQSFQEALAEWRAACAGIHHHIHVYISVHVVGSGNTVALARAESVTTTSCLCSSPNA